MGFVGAMILLVPIIGGLGLYLFSKHAEITSDRETNKLLRQEKSRVEKTENEKQAAIDAQKREEHYKGLSLAREGDYTYNPSARPNPKHGYVDPRDPHGRRKADREAQESTLSRYDRKADDVATGTLLAYGAATAVATICS